MIVNLNEKDKVLDSDIKELVIDDSEIIKELDDNDNSYEEEIKVEEFSKCDDSFKLYLSDIAKYPLLTREEEYDLAVKYKKTGKTEYKQELVNHNLRLVINIAKHFKVAGVSILDLVQEGNVGLMTAADKFDPDLGYKFSTYSTWWIKQAILRYIANSGRLIRIPVHANECLYKYNKFVSDWKKNNADKPLPDIKEIAENLNVSVDTLKICLRSNDVISLNTPVGDEQDTTIGDFISDDKSIEDEIEYKALRACVAEVLDDLTEREQNIIKLRFGLDNNKVHTLEEVGEIYGITRERIRQIEAKAIRKLRHPKRSRILRDFIETGNGV